MQTYKPHRLALLLATAAALLAAACEAPDQRALLPQDPLASDSYGATLLECPVNHTASVSGTIGPLGGTLEVDGHRLTVPPLALLTRQQLTLQVPASNYVRVSVTAAGVEGLEFRSPAALTVSYQRCTRSNIDRGELGIFYINPGTHEILEALGGEDDKDARTVTTTLDHLSDYAVGAN